MKILLLTGGFLPEFGGVQKFLNHIAKNLNKYGNEITIITCTHRQDLKTSEKQNDLQIYRNLLAKQNRNYVEFLFNTVRMFVFLLKNFKKLSSQDVIHLHDYWTFMWIFPIIPLLKIPIFMTFCGYDGYPPRRFPKLMVKLAEKFVKGSICIGPYLPKWYGIKPDYIMIGGVEVPRDIPRNHLEESVAFIGRLAEDTNVLEFLECLAILKDVYGIELPLHICGDGPLRSKIKEYAQHNNLKIIMHGWVKDPQNYIIRCHYVFVSSVLSILETMVYKRPVFTLYNNPLKKDYIYTIGGEDIMFIAGSPKELAEKLYSAIKNPESIWPILERAYTFAIDQNYENMTNIYLNLYRKGNVSDS